MRWIEAVSDEKARYWLGRHLLFWLLVLAGYSYVSYTMHPSAERNGLEIVRATAIMLVYTIGLTYLALDWVIPSALADRYEQFAGRVVLFLAGSWVLLSLYRGYIVIPLLTGKFSLLPSYQQVIALCDWYIALGIVGVATGIRLYRFWYNRTQANQQLAHETLTIKLQVLKAQIHPHFLFNTLNNLYSLTLHQVPQASDMVLKLSAMLHYMIHECNQPAVPLAKELHFLENYIELEKLRYGPRLTVLLTVTGDISTTTIAPLLLIPFVENAFKHGSAQQTDQAFIELSLVVTDHQLLFSIENSLDEKSVSTGWQKPGSIGLSNVQKRLSLLYPNAHNLFICPKIDQFVVQLTVQFNQKAELNQLAQMAINSPY